MSESKLWRFCYLTCALLLTFLLLTGQIASAANAKGGNHDKNFSHDWLKNNPGKYLKPLLNIKVRNGEAVFASGLVNMSGWMNRARLSDISYTVAVYPDGKKEEVWSGTYELKENTQGIMNWSRKPGYSHPFCFMNYLDISKAVWDLHTDKGEVVKPGKYKAVVQWQAKVNNSKEYETASISKTFMIQQKDVRGLKPDPSPDPRNKPDVYVDLAAAIQDGRLNIGIALVNESSDKVAFDFNSYRRYDILISDSDGDIVFRSDDGTMYAQAVNHIHVDADSEYNFDRYYWDFTDTDGRKIPAGKYTVKVIINAENKAALEKKYDLDLEDKNTVTVTDNDIKYDIDAILKAEVTDRKLRLDFAIRNRTSEDVTLRFPTSREYRVTITDKKGNTVFRSDDGMNFLTVLTDRKLDAGETRRYEPIVLNLSDMRLKPGKYDILTEFQVYEILDEEGDQISKSRYRLTAYKLLDLDESDISGS